MSILIDIQNLTKTFGAQTLFKDISMGIFRQERLGLIGPNGAGKSTLLKIIAGLEGHDSGEIISRKKLRMIYVAQQERFDPDLSIQQTITDSLKDYFLDDIEIQVKAAQAITQAGFEDAEQKVGKLSGGWKKRLALSIALVKEPDLLLLDEPTNHLDVDGILWLEDLLARAHFAFLAISHDRYFLENSTNRMIELSPRYDKGFLKTEGSYSDFLEKREAYIAEKEKHELILSNKVRRETEWLRRGPKARTTKSKSRMDAAHELTDQLTNLKKQNRSERSAQIDFVAGEKKSKVLLKAHQISKSYGSLKLLDKFNLKISSGMKLGLLGKNGSGKSTLMKLLSGKAEPDEGTIKPGVDVKIVSFEQDRSSLDQNELLKHALAPSGGDSVIYQDKPIHIFTWAKRFLFKPEQLQSPVSSLSGGEQARVLIARLMLQPADILLLDEPTNDLDIPSLDVLEKSLLDFPGAIILVTHDRYLLDRVCNELLSFEGDGQVTGYADLNQWLKHQKNKPISEPVKTEKKETVPEKKKTAPKKKLSYKEQYELDHMEENISKLDEEVKALTESLEQPETFNDPEKMARVCEELTEKQNQLDHLYERWEYLENF
jgi:ATP-binding cassette subfamily F protein uup